MKSKQRDGIASNWCHFCRIQFLCLNLELFISQMQWRKKHPNTNISHANHLHFVSLSFASWCCRWKCFWEISTSTSIIIVIAQVNSVAQQTDSVDWSVRFDFCHFSPSPNRPFHWRTIKTILLQFAQINNLMIRDISPWKAIKSARNFTFSFWSHLKHKCLQLHLIMLWLSRLVRWLGFEHFFSLNFRCIDTKIKSIWSKTGWKPTDARRQISYVLWWLYAWTIDRLQCAYIIKIFEQYKNNITNNNGSCVVFSV